MYNIFLTIILFVSFLCLKELGNHPKQNEDVPMASVHAWKQKREDRSLVIEEKKADIHLLYKLPTLF